MAGAAEDYRDLKLKSLLKRWRLLRLLVISTWITGYPLCVGAGLLIQSQAYVWVFSFLGLLVAALALTSGLSPRLLRTARAFHYGNFAEMKFKSRLATLIAALTLGGHLTLFATLSSGTLVNYMASNSTQLQSIGVFELLGIAFSLAALGSTILCSAAIIVADAVSWQVNWVLRREYHAWKFVNTVELESSRGHSIVHVHSRESKGQKWHCRLSYLKQINDLYTFTSASNVGIWKSAATEILRTKDFGNYLLVLDRSRYANDLIPYIQYLDYLAACRSAEENTRIAELGDVKESEFPWFNTPAATTQTSSS